MWLVVFVMVVLVVTSSSPVFALSVHPTEKPLHVTLLAAQELNGTLIGHTADLFLEIKPGFGRVFLETFPLTKVDTQISTRFAKEVACNYFDLACSGYDFIYTIRSDSSIIGGPSAGAALAALTAAGLLGLPVNESVAITGTINSGGLIGNVGGLRAKVDAARSVGISTVLVPPLLQTNVSDDLTRYARAKNVTLVEATDLNTVLFAFTGKTLLRNNVQLTPPADYTSIMKSISEDICLRSKTLYGQLSDVLLNASERSSLLNLTTRAVQAQVNGSYYSSASYCFGLNVQLRSMLYERGNLSAAKILSKAEQLLIDINRFDQEVRSRELKTITDLQTFGVVAERLHEARAFLNRLRREESKAFLLSYAEERFFSAKIWSRFFSLGGLTYTLDQQVVQRSCIEKVQEAKERLQYISLFLPDASERFGRDIDEAEERAQSGDFVLCLIQASQAKGSTNAVLSTLGVEPSGVAQLLDAKLAALEHLIGRTVQKRAFPLLGFSYYEYAQSLRSHDPISALLYSEYALELSNLDIYFHEDKAVLPLSQSGLFGSAAGTFLFGFGAGFAVAFLLTIVLFHGRTSDKNIDQTFKTRKKLRIGKF